MANKDRYTAEQVIAAIKLTRGLVTMAADTLGCDPDTVRNYAKRYKAVRQALEDARDKMLDRAELSLYDALLEAEPWAVKFILSTLGKSRGYVTRHELGGSDGNTLTIEVKYADPPTGPA